MKWYLRAASDGYPAAQNNVGFMYANGRGTLQDANVAFNWYRKAAEKGYAAAENNLGYLYASGLQPDIEAAIRWYQKYAKHGYAPAEFNLGLIYLNDPSRKNMSKALQWLRSAAEHGLPEAENQLGLLYEQGEGVPKDSSIAEKWYNIAVKQGFTQARRNLEKLSLQH